MNKTSRIARQKRIPLNEQAYELIKHRIENRQYAEEEMISVPDLIDEISSSRRPIMDAMTRLSQEGLIEIIPQVGCKVATQGKRPVQPATSRSDFAYDFIKDSLIQGKLSFGEYIDVEVYMDRIGASRQPVMDALRRLATEGFVTIIPQVGCRVASPSTDEIVDFFRVFAATDGVCGAMAAERRTKEQLDALRKAADRISELQDSNFTPSKFAKTYRIRNRQFHKCVHDMCHSETVTKLVENYWDLSDFYIWAAPGMVINAESIKGAQEEHVDIIKLLDGRDAKRIKPLIEKHLMAFAEMVVEAHNSEGQPEV